MLCCSQTEETEDDSEEVEGRGDILVMFVLCGGWAERDI